MANAHAILTSPPSWNPSPSKTSPCGAGKAFTTSQKVLVPGAALSLTWKVIAGDGTGPVTVSIDPTGGTSFTTVVGTATTTITTTGTFTLSGLTVPSDLVCTGAGGLCTLQAKSSTNWYSCTTVSVQSTSTASSTGSSEVISSTGSTTGTASTCTTVPSLSFCSAVTGKSVDYSENPQLLPAAVSDWDLTVNSTYVQNINSKLVFTHQHNPQCYAAYKRFLCASSFPLCGKADKGSCADACADVHTLCGVNATHASLFVCENVNVLTDSDSYGQCMAVDGNAARSIRAPNLAITYAYTVIVVIATIIAAVVSHTPTRDPW